MARSSAVRAAMEPVAIPRFEDPVGGARFREKVSLVQVESPAKHQRARSKAPDWELR